MCVDEVECKLFGKQTVSENTGLYKCKKLLIACGIQETKFWILMLFICHYSLLNQETLSYLLLHRNDKAKAG